MTRIRVVRVGVGQVGSAFLALLEREAPRILRAHGIELELAASVRTGRWCVGADLGWKAARRPLAVAAAAAAGSEARVVVVEAGAGETAGELTAALASGCGAVLANKKPLCGPAAGYRRLMAAARRGGGIRYECTVGSALPVVEPLRAMLAGGDRIRRIRAALSGTLGFVMTGLGEGRALAAVVAEARRRGLTEPDPRDDLGGVDVARKALILSRLVGWERELVDVEVESLVPAELRESSIEAFLEELGPAGKGLEARAKKARARGRVLRYLAEIDGENAKVGLQEFEVGSPFGGLGGTDNLFMIESDWYATGPLVIRGPGAGVALTAAGLLGDLVGLAREGSGR